MWMKSFPREQQIMTLIKDKISGQRDVSSGEQARPRAWAYDMSDIQKQHGGWNEKSKDSVIRST